MTQLKRAESLAVLLVQFVKQAAAGGVGERSEDYVHTTYYT